LVKIVVDARDAVKAVVGGEGSALAAEPGHVGVDLAAALASELRG
jgi:hypothetical protein